MTESFPRRPARPPRFMVSVPADDSLSDFLIRHEEVFGAQSRAGFEPSTGRAQSQMRQWSNGVSDVELEMTPAEKRLLRRGPREDKQRMIAMWRRWTALGTATRDVLWAAYGPPAEPHRVPGDAQGELYKLYAVALLTAAADHGLPKTEERKAIGGHPAKNGRDEWVLGLCRKPGVNVEILAAMRVQATAIIAQAHALWCGGDGPEPAIFAGHEVRETVVTGIAPVRATVAFVSPREAAQAKSKAEERAEQAAWEAVREVIGGQVAVVARERGVDSADLWSAARGIHRQFLADVADLTERADGVVSAIATIGAGHRVGAFVRKVGT